MPKIPTFQAGGPAGPQLVGPIARATGEGAALAEVGGQVGQLGQALAARKAQGEVSRLNAEVTRAQAELTNQQAEFFRTADPNDPDNAKKFQQVVDDRLSEIGSGLGTSQGRKHFETLSAGVSSNFLTSGFSKQQSLSGVAAQQDFETLRNQITSTAVSDPASMKNAMAVSEIALSGLVEAGSMGRATALKEQTRLNTDIALATAQSLIASNPNAATNLIKDGFFNEFIDGNQKSQLLQAADTMSKSVVAQEKRVEEAAAKEAAGSVLESFITEEGTVAVPPDAMLALLNEPGFNSPAGVEQQRTMFNLIRTLQSSPERAMKTNPIIFNDVWGRAGLPAGDANRPKPDEVLNMVGRGLSFADSQHILQRIDMSLTPEGKSFVSGENDLFTAAKDALRTQRDATIADPDGALNFKEYRQWAIPEAQRLRDKGLSAQEIYGEDGELSKRIQSFKRSREEVQAARRASMRGLPTPEFRRDPAATAPIAITEDEQGLSDEEKIKRILERSGK